MALGGGYAEFRWRDAQTHINGVETCAAIVWTALLAMIADADPTPVARLVWNIAGLRRAYWPIYSCGSARMAAGSAPSSSSPPSWPTLASRPWRFSLV